MAKLGTRAGWSGNYCEDLTETTSLTPGDSGKVFFLNSSTEFTVTLPSVADAGAGFNCKFIVKAAPDGANYVVSSASSSDYVLGSVDTGADSTADTSDGTDTQINFIDGSAVAGDWVKLVCDGSAWYIVGGLGKVAAGITIS